MTQLGLYSQRYLEAREGTICFRLLQWKRVFLGWDCIQSSSTSLKIQPMKTTVFVTMSLVLLSANLCYKEITILIHCPSADQSDGRRHNCYIKDSPALPVSTYSLNRALLMFSPSAPLSFFFKNNVLILFSAKKNF